MKQTPTAMSAQELKALNRKIRKAQKGRKGGQTNVIIEVVPLLEGIFDERWHVHKAASQVVATAFSACKDEVDYACYTCGEPWSIARGPAAVMITQFVGVEDVGLASGLCSECVSGGREHWVEAIKRDFDTEHVMPLAPGGHA